MKILSKKRFVSLIGAFTGGVAGYLYYYFIGCSTGNCAITSRPFNSIIYGAIMGYLLVSDFGKDKKY
ncbi:DUF6132 family protein [Elizabethkingia miricola]|uniref:DUF6132 family protein n=1 Tax=Elizabethkingia miricola TaxID=172045 RepID=UPI00293CC851|nr:DUF6132 family protein [Elizabethkingia miricola]MDV3462902.1 hypothetical protein [Elizabethkingia anophelis]WQM38075.1 DUF6132 family protein [Elizabethkingia miricola]